MMGYPFVLVFSIICFYDITKHVYKFIKGQYNPYIFRNKRESTYTVILRSCFWIGFIIVGSVVMRNNKLLSVITVIFICYSFFYIVSVSVLNYLCYRKNKDSKIILQTVIYGFLMIIVCIWLWMYIKPIINFWNDNTHVKGIR